MTNTQSRSDSNVQQKRDYVLSRGGSKMFGWIRTSHEARVQSTAALGFGTGGNGSAAQRGHFLKPLFNTPSCKTPKPAAQSQYILHSLRLLFELQMSWEFKWMRITPHSRLYKWIWHWVWWLDESQQQSIYQALGPAQTGTQWTLERMFFLFVYRDASAELYLFTF